MRASTDSSRHANSYAQQPQPSGHSGFVGDPSDLQSSIFNPYHQGQKANLANSANVNNNRFIENAKKPPSNSSQMAMNHARHNGTKNGSEPYNPQQQEMNKQKLQDLLKKHFSEADPSGAGHGQHQSRQQNM